MTLCIFRGRDCVRHDVSGEHPESPDRLYAIDDQLLASGLDMACEHIDAQPATREELMLAHDPGYIDSLYQQSPGAGTLWLDADTGMTPVSLSAALYAAGAGLQAVDWSMAGTTRRAFCLVRPPGHHAESAKAMGFCLFNNVALAARHALVNHGLQRVAIVDFDVHHGNGTEHILGGDARVLMCSSFQYPLYPNCGELKPADNLLSVPLAAGTEGQEYRRKVAGWFDALREFSPQLILVSAGFDGHAQDPLAQLRLREDDFKWLGFELGRLADECCEGRVVSMLEGGYDLSALGRSVVAYLKGLLGDEQESSARI
ncbi:histone deacetylase family protein [Alteromonas aestuariivivens]|uniref:Histone deacetylase family protein n=1 Tax=Alteromonas aestuariivivens TaxID=1938339 RepID=A0A3D8M7A1_9ALTE|nr:histone deacetylase family protein [Alteromonas aestuariivivens]RDV25503.1 histone deacetylase family protein [Alteromonas aestuariivivens]